MSFQEMLSKEKIRIEEATSKFFDQFSQEGTFYSQFLYQFYADLKNYLLRGGKRLRPAALVMMYKGLGGKDEAIYDLAICVELLHNASLVHDDIIDHDLVRRGNPSFHAFYSDWFEKNFQQSPDDVDFGLAMGILGGDLLIDLGQEAILQSNFNPKVRLRAIEYYLLAYKELINGVTAESYLQHRPIDEVSEMDYLDMIRGKTAALFEKAILIGALAADETEKLKDEISEFAVLLGQAFQIRDDILGVFGDPAKTGKSIEGDIREGKKTLLAIYGSKNPDFKTLYGKKDLTSQEIKTVRQILKDTSALDRTKAKALELAEKANEALQKIKLDKESLRFFIALIKYVQERML